MARWVALPLVACWCGYTLVYVKSVNAKSEAVRAEYRENEIFPPTDTVEDWLKLIDYDPENVVRVTPVRAEEPRPEKQSGRIV